MREGLDAVEETLRRLEGKDVRAPDISAWSALQHLHHALLVARVALDNTLELIALPAGEAPGGLTLIGRLVLWSGWIPRGKGRAPDSVIPPERCDRETIARLLGETRTRLERIEDEWPETPPRGRKRHFVFGFLDAREWLLVAAIHTEHHLRIVREILRRSNAAPAT